MLKRFSIDNFKSLSDFSLPAPHEGPFPQFVCLVGLNGSGKTTVLQALDFLSQLVVGDIEHWLESRRWEKTQLLMKGSKRRTISFSMEFEDLHIGTLKWSGAYNVLEGRCVSEEIDFHAVAKSPHFNSLQLRYEKGAIRDHRGWKADLTSDFSGSVFGSLKRTVLKKDDRIILTLLHFYLSGVKSLEMLSPSAMRNPSRDAVDVGTGGEKLAAFVNGLSPDEKRKLLAELSIFYPRLEKIGARSGRYGWKRLFAAEAFDSEFEWDARHINDGLLRIAAIVAQTVAEEAFTKQMGRKTTAEDIGNPDQKEYQFILLEEIENGINPELVEKLVRYLTSVRQQIFVTTHSPLILNFLTDRQALESVFLMYRRTDGSTSAVRLFELPQAAERLAVMGAGEAYLDLELEKLSRDLQARHVSESA